MPARAAKKAKKTHNPPKNATPPLPLIPFPALFSHPDLFKRILSFASSHTLATCLRLNKDAYSIVGSILYKEIDLLQSGPSPLDGSEHWPNRVSTRQTRYEINMKNDLLAHTTKLRISGWWSMQSRPPGNPVLLPKLYTLVAEQLSYYPFFRAAPLLDSRPVRLVYKQVGFMHRWDVALDSANMERLDQYVVHFGKQSASTYMDLASFVAVRVKNKCISVASTTLVFHSGVTRWNIPPAPYRQGIPQIDMYTQWQRLIVRLLLSNTTTSIRLVNIASFDPVWISAPIDSADAIVAKVENDLHSTINNLARQHDKDSAACKARISFVDLKDYVKEDGARDVFSEEDIAGMNFEEAK